MKTFFDYSFTSKNLNNNDSMENLKNLAIDKLDHHLKKFLPEDTKITVSFKVVGFKNKFKVMIYVNKRFIRAEVSNKESMQGAINEAIDILVKQLRRYKDRLIRVDKRNIGLGEKLESISNLSDNNMGDTENSEEIEDIDVNEMKIERVKSFAIKPMSPEEAAMEIELMNYDFYVFVNSNTEKVNVIYKRKNGSYGLIEPKY